MPKKIITKEMNIAEVLHKYPQTVEVLQNSGVKCVGCVASSFESLEEGLSAHGLEVESVVEEMNKIINNEE